MHAKSGLQSRVGGWCGCGRVVVLVVLCGGLVWARPMVACAGEARHEDHDRVRELVRSGEILSLERILHRHAQAVEGRVLEVDLKKNRGVMVYEVEVVDARGRVMEFEFDAKTGILLQAREGD